uniref:structural maintenance of chromosomes flexible hinge domain-containing protein 1 n=1 Tax=Semicossyphus pulcher TaxID=241346 RepID=UPI0037E73A68
MFNARDQRLAASSRGEKTSLKRICVYDCRLENDTTDSWITGSDYSDFLRDLQKKFSIRPHEAFVLVTTDRTVLDFAKFEELPDGSTLHLLQRADQALPVATKEHIKFLPHFKTLTESGLYEYYASEGQNPLSYALAELIDNALSANAKNTGVRTIEIRMMFDETLGKPAIIVLDNGCGMTSKQLNNWAVYRLSKFARENSTFASEQEGYVRPAPVPRSLNSDVSYFGVGGKQAVFFIGDSVRMISKPIGSPDVHELILSKEDFESKERKKEDIYSTVITNRKPGTFSHVKKPEERFLHNLIREEIRKDSFTAVVITGVRPEHTAFVKEHFIALTRQLAHIYHYYIHGVSGNIRSSSSNSDHPPKVDIQVTCREKSPKFPRAINLKEVVDDMQTLYINSAADTFEFKASASGDSGTVEGIIRYHPFLFDKETYPQEPDAVEAPPDDDDDGNDDNESGVGHQARGKRSIFDCFWNGRLIPYDTGIEFDWCTRPRKKAKLPAECYSRFSGVLFTDDRFKVTTNKLSFVDLEPILKNKDTIFTRVVNGQKHRGNIQKEFTQWLQNCHDKHDKQIKFIGYKKTITRHELPKKMQHPWDTFSSIQWDRKVYKAGQLVKTQKTGNNLYGTVVQFLLYGNTEKTKGSVFATGGEVELALEPKALHDKNKIIPISKIDKTASDEAIRNQVHNDSAKLPDKLTVNWPEGIPWPQNAVRPAGTPLGPLKIEILNMNGESVSRLPSVDRGPGKPLIVQLKIVLHGPKGVQEVVSFTAHHAAKWGFWFKKIATLTQLGKYTLSLNTALNESDATVIGGKELPSFKLNFSIKGQKNHKTTLFIVRDSLSLLMNSLLLSFTAGSAHRFVMSEVNAHLRVGVQFNIPLQIKDVYDHSAVIPPDLKPVIKCSGLELSFEKVDTSGASGTFTIRGVKARGKVLNNQQSMTHDLEVTLPGLKEDTQRVRIILLPGSPHSLHVKPEVNPVENGNPAGFKVEVHDEAGNVTSNPKQTVRCEVAGHPSTVTDISSSGAGLLMTKPINLKIIEGEPQMLKAKFVMPGRSNVAAVVSEVQVVPSTRVATMELYSSDDENLVLRNNEKIEWLAGGLLENLFYKLYDEAGREVPLSDEIASRIKVNWTADVNLRDLAQGKLPVVQVPSKVSEKPFYQVSYQTQNVFFSFHIVPRPDEPKRLRVTLPQHTVKLGETLPGDITLELVDQYDNLTKTLTSTCVNHMTVEAEGLDKSAITFEWQESSRCALVNGVQFQSGSPGAREICFTYRSFVESVTVTVAPGVPAQLKLVSGPEQPLQVLNGHGITTPFIVQLFDQWGNPSQDQRVVVQLKTSPQTLKMVTAVTSQPSDAEGKACFTVNSVSGPKGYYQLVFECPFNEKPIQGPSVNLTVNPDPKKPVSLPVQYDRSAKFPAGGRFPVFMVTVVSEEGNPMTTFNPAAVSMLLWKGELSGMTPPPTATELRCSKPMENERRGCFHFRDKEIPEQVGKYTIQFSLHTDTTKDLFSHQITINVEANQPVKLGPVSQPPTPVVSYSRDISKRTLVENMTLMIMDSYGNPAGLGLNGKVVASIKIAGDVSNRTLPLFDGNTNSCNVSLVKGKANVPRLTIMENSPGENGGAYILLFKPEVPMVRLAPFELPFRFYNVENQQNMSELSRTKDKLTAAVAAQKELFNTYEAVLPLLSGRLQDAIKKEADQREKLNERNMIIAPNVSVPNLERLEAEKTAEAEGIRNTPRRVCSIRDSFRGQQDVLGMVGRLAFVQDDAAARVISWHIRGDMDCVITKTTAAAQRIYHDTHGRQQVMGLDSVFVQQGNRPLPHMRNGRPLFDPPGNPVFARNLLIYPQDPESCNIVFTNLLRDTIVIDDLDSANNYRRAVVQNRTQCPTILTRQGERVSSNGKFGGLQNKAPPIEKLEVFGAPIPPHYYALMEQIELLRQYRALVQKRDKATKDHEEHLKKMTSPETLQKKRDMEEKIKQLEEIERQLASAAVRPVRRAPEDAGEPSGIAAKRARQT